MGELWGPGLGTRLKLTKIIEGTFQWQALGQFTIGQETISKVKGDGFTLCDCVGLQWQTRFHLRHLFIGDVMMFDTLRLVVSSKGKDEAHHSLKVSLKDLLASNCMHSDLLASHELQDTLQVLSHPLQGLGLVLDTSYFLTSCKRGD